MHKLSIIALTLLYTALLQAQVPSNPFDVSPLLPGEKMPPLELLDSHGQAHTLDPMALQKPLVITFYRGGWCPYCNTHLADLRHAEKELVKLGFEVLFISPDSPENLTSTLKTPDPGYTLLSDADMAASRAFGIAFTVDQATLEKYRGYGIDLEKASGHAHHQLPAPSTYLIGADGVIRFQYTNPDYTVRLSDKVLLAAALDYVDRELRKKSSRQ